MRILSRVYASRVPHPFPGVPVVLLYELARARFTTRTCLLASLPVGSPSLPQPLLSAGVAGSNSPLGEGRHPLTLPGSTPVIERE